MFIFTYMWNNVAVFTKEQLFAQNNSERENAIDSGTYLYSEKWNFTDLRKCYYEMSRALRLPRVMSKFWIYLSYNKTRQFTISSFHSFLMWASRLFQTGQALNLKEGICITFCIIWPLWSLTNYFEKFDALTDINAVANFGLRGLIHHGGGALIKSTTINSSKSLFVEKVWIKQIKSNAK